MYVAVYVKSTIKLFAWCSPLHGFPDTVQQWRTCDSKYKPCNLFSMCGWTSEQKLRTCESTTGLGTPAQVCCAISFKVCCSYNDARENIVDVMYLSERWRVASPRYDKPPPIPSGQACLTPQSNNKHQGGRKLGGERALGGSAWIIFLLYPTFTKASLISFRQHCASMVVTYCMCAD